MTITERVAYLKGLAEGLKIDDDSKEGKLISAIIDVLEEIACEIEDLNDNVLDICDELDAVSDDLSDVEECVYGDDDCCCGEDDDADCCCGDDEDYEFEVTCPACGEDVIVEEADLVEGSIVCPSCGEKLEFDFDEEISSDDENDED